MSAQMPLELRALLDALLEKPTTDVEATPQVQRFKLTLLKTISQSTRPTKIRATLDDWRTLREYGFNDVHGQDTSQGPDGQDDLRERVGFVDRMEQPLHGWLILTYALHQA